MNEAEYLMKNYGDRGGCYPSRPKAEADNTLRDLHDSSYNAKAEFNNCFIMYSKIIPSLFTIYMRKPEIVIGESKFVPFRLSKRTENVGCRLSPSNFYTLLSLSSLFRYTFKKVLLPQSQIQLLNVYKRDIHPDGLRKW